MPMDTAALAHPKGSTKLDRAIAHKVSRLADKKALDAWAFAVKDRDRWQDRKTGKRVLRTRQLDPMRGEAHHIEPKSNRALRYDIRNGLTLSLQSHEDVEHHRVRIEGTVFFTIRGCRYINANFPVIFVRL